MRALILLSTFTLSLPAVEPNILQQAADAFQSGRTNPEHYREAAALFAQAELTTMTAEQRAAWAYCRLRLAAEEWNRSKGEASLASRVIREATESLALAPDHAGLQSFGRSIIAASGGQPPAIARPKAAESGWFSLETANFRVRFPAAAKAAAESLAEKIEKARTEIFTRWSGPPTAWTLKCEVVLHADAAEFARATGLSNEATGHALVQLKDGQPSLRRIDLRADDGTAAIDALPRELTHVVMADLFPSTAPPRWAEDGMAILAMSPETVERHLATAGKLAASNKLPSLAQLQDNFSQDATATLVASVAYVDHFTHAKDARPFTVFLRDSKRYGFEKALERQFGYTNLKDVDAAMRRTLK